MTASQAKATTTASHPASGPVSGPEPGPEPSPARPAAQTPLPGLPFPDPPQVPAWIRALCVLYDEALSELRFPEVDATRLSARLTAVDEHALEVAQARAQLEAAERALRETHGQLERTARRAHAYARVYAQDQPALSERVEAAAPPPAADPAAGPRRKGARRGRRRASTEDVAPKATAKDSTKDPARDPTKDSAKSPAKTATKAPASDAGGAPADPPGNRDHRAA